MAIHLIAILLLFSIVQSSSAQCPPKCVCSKLSSDDAPEKLQVVCDGISLAEISEKLTSADPVDLIVKNGQFDELPNAALKKINLGKLTLLQNGIERIANGVFKDLSKNFRELLIRDAALQVIENSAFNDLQFIQNISIQDAHSLEKLPKLQNLPELRFLGINNNSVHFLESGFLSNLPKLKEISLRKNRIEIFDMQAFAKIPAVTSLDLSGNLLKDISFLPLVLRSLPSLNFLLLAQNKIQTIPVNFLDGLSSLLLIDLRRNEIAKLPERLISSDSGNSVLRELYLGQNFINEIPADFFDNLTGLKTLSFANNSLSLIGQQFAPLKDLLYLRLEGNRLQRISNDAFATLARLQVLSLENNHLTLLENGVITDKLELQTLDLSRNYLQEFRGTELKNLPKLQNLFLSSNKLRNLYAGFETLPDLRRLDLSSNQISNIDDNTFANLRNLETLQLENNLFMKVPMNALTALPALERLTLGGNRIHFLAAFKPIGRLKYLSLDKNILQNIDTDVFSQLSELRQLFLNDNQISVLQPGAFGNLYTLYILDVSRNFIRTVPENVFHNLLALETLDLSANEIERLGTGLLGNLPSLRSADFSQNRIVLLEDNAFTKTPNLMQLNISRNQLNVVPGIIGKLGKLRRLDLGYNQIRRVEDQSFDGLSQLEIFFLQKNPLCYISGAAFRKLDKLTSLDLSSTDLRYVPQTAFKPNQDYSQINMDGLTVECDCNMRWLQAIKPLVRCGYVGSVSANRISQISFDTLPCPKGDPLQHASEECQIQNIATRPPRTGMQSPLDAGADSSAGTERPDDNKILMKGSATQAWLTVNEHKEKAEELAAIQAAKQTRNPNSGVLLRSDGGLLAALAALFFALVVL
ncbi:insulin-like growth factor-binding protein complex acid labile subunit [Paramacrobiotus metropolitanus]|uniref:insulin-like growth factor-binding protein complex acid labile subunit n=1 Tax=Paramacrobiotus metropolitanus TaxID=2943436 RepID=UPI0024461EAC|nr:insulin-like growth factor-binding protein complex acid labile subunit [Paramacrobiotus metropolitanus]